MGKTVRICELKTWKAPFAAVWAGDKTYEVRKNDRDFQVGDELLLREFEPCTCGTTIIPLCDDDRCVGLGSRYTGRSILASITYMTRGGDWGLPEGLCVLGIRVKAKADL